MYSANMQVAEDKSCIPDPRGYKILVAIPKANEKTDGGLYKPDIVVERESVGTMIGYVVAVGPDAYKDKDKFPSGAYCGHGDFVVFRNYSGTRFKVSGQEFRLLNDDGIEAVVEDPRKIERA